MAASDLISDVLRKIFSDPAEAEAYSEAPGDYLVAEGLGDIDLSGIDMGEQVAQVANELALDNSVTTTLIEVSEPVPAGPVLAPLAPPAAAPAPVPAGASSGGGGGGSAPAPAPAPVHVPAPISSIEELQQIVNNYTTVVYEGDETITNNLFDNSQTLELDFKDVEGDIDLDLTQEAVNANGPGAVAAGHDIENSNIASGEGAVAFDGANNGVVNTGENSGVIADGNVDDTIIGDGNTQVGDGDDATVVSGDGNTVNQVDGSDNVIQSGDGNENTQVDGDDATLIEAGGDVQNTDIDAESGAEVNSVSGNDNQTVQGDDNNTGFGSGDVADFGEHNDFGEAQIGFGGSVNQDNDVADSGNTAIDQSDNSVDNSFDDHSDNSFVDNSDNSVVDVDDNSAVDSFNDESDNSDNSVEEFTAEVDITESDHADVDDLIDD